MRRAMAVAMILAAGSQVALAAPAPQSTPSAKPSAAAKPAPAPKPSASAKPAPKPSTAANPGATPAVKEASGTVLDDKTGQPIAGAYVYQPGSLNGVLTDGKGKFRLSLDPKYGDAVVVAKETYEPLQVAVKAGEMTVKLAPLTTYAPFTPQAETKAPQAAIGSLFNANFQMLNQGISGGGTGTVNGFVTGQLAVQGQYRLSDWLFRLEGSRNRVPVDVDGFPYKPTVSFDTWQGRLGANYVLPLGWNRLELAVGPEYLVNFIQADNRSTQDAKPIPYTGTFVDRFPLRQAIGANLILGYRPIDPLYIALEGAYHPFVFSATEPGTPGLGFLQYWNAGVRADYAIFTGVGVGVAYRHYDWFGSIHDGADQFSVGLSFNPYMLN